MPGSSGSSGSSSGTTLVTTTAPTAVGDNIWAEIGGLYEEKAFQRRIDALTNPATYATERKAALDEIKKASETAFKTAYDGYVKAGLSPDLAKANATNSAKSEYHNQQNVFNLQYGQGTDQIFTGAAANKGTMGTQGTLAQAAPRARARRAPAKKSAATKSKKAKKAKK